MMKATWTRMLPLATAVLGLGLFVGCERKETIVDVETPAGEVEVERNVDTGEVEVEATDN